MAGRRIDEEMSEDPEVKAMTDVFTSLTGLEREAQERVLRWVTSKLGIVTDQGTSRKIIQRSRNGGDSEDARPEKERQFEHFVDLFDVTEPGTEAERALVGGYWFQVELGGPSFNAQQVNNVLKDVGHGIGNITVAFSDLQDRSPALVRQMSKSGKTKQARKTYKLTANGIRAVESLIAGEGGED